MTWTAEIWHGPSGALVGHACGRTVRDVRRDFTAWKREAGVRLNTGDYFLDRWTRWE